MHLWRQLLVLVSVAGAIVFLGPATALATGPSAGDQQYVDPLGGSHSGSHHSSGGSHSTTQSPAPTTPTTATTPVSSTPTVSPTVTTTASTTTPPTATTASATSTAKDPPKSLPRTGFDALLAIAIGAGMSGAGLAVRRGVRHPD